LAIAGAFVALVGALVPPLFGAAGRDEWAASVQLGLLAIAVPALGIVGWPLAGRNVPAFLGRWAACRVRHPELQRSVAFVVLDVGTMVLWRLPAVTDAAVRHRILLVPEALTLLVAGVGLWLELVRCPPFAPRVARPWRAVLAALAMWGVWVDVYVVGLSSSSWYPAFRHGAGSLSARADQQIAVGVLFGMALCAFVPVVFADAIAWLGEGGDPDDELRRMVRRARRWGTP
jgi:hypothetical protein